MAAMYGDFSFRARGDGKLEKSLAPEIVTQRTPTHTYEHVQTLNVSCSVHSENKLGVNYPSVEMQC